MVGALPARAPHRGGRQRCAREGLASSARRDLFPGSPAESPRFGQTAPSSNYLFTSVSCSAFFMFSHLYGKLEYYQLYAIVACVWLFNLTISPIWLRYFQFGPAEWVWRSLTYWKRQPMRRNALEEREALAA